YAGSSNWTVQEAA
nr:NADH-enoyl ACP reductase [Brassica napus, Peptide Partial, 13 aa] [Brassica napus]